MSHSGRIGARKRLTSLTALIVGLGLACLGDGTSHQQTLPASGLFGSVQHGQHQRSMLQLGKPWTDNGGSWPAEFTDLDRAIETQRIFRSVAAERNKTAIAMQNLDAAWTGWIRTYNITFNSTQEADLRRSIFNVNVQRANQLNQLAGPEVAFGINRFTALTPEEFLARYTGDTQDDQGITVTPEEPERVSTPASDYLATLATLNTTNTSTDNSTNTTDTTNSTGSGNGTSSGSGSAPGGGSGSGLFSIDSSSGRGGIMLPGASQQASLHSGSAGARRLQQEQQQQQWQDYLEQQEHLDLLKEYWQQWREGGPQEKQPRQSLWQRFLAFLGLDGLVTPRHNIDTSSRSRRSAARSLPFDFAEADEAQQHSFSSSKRRRLQQVILPSANSPFQPPSFCSQQVAFPYQFILPFKSVDWLRGRVVRPVRQMTGNCSNSFAYVATALAESTMLIQGYNGTAKDLSEAQIMECFPGGSCSRGGSVHVVLNFLACNGVAAAGPSPGGSTVGTYPSAAVDAGKPGQCAIGKYYPVRTGVTGWAFVPNNEYAFGQALSKTPIKVSVDASMLQSYRAGYLGCNVLSGVANHAMLAVGYNYQIRAGAPPPGSNESYTFFSGPSYWMLQNSWGLLGSVDGYVYVRKGCERATPLGMMLNRGVMPLWNQTESFLIGRLQCANDTVSNQGCSQDLLVRLAGYCAGVDDYLPSGMTNNCSCSCIPV